MNLDDLHLPITRRRVQAEWRDRALCAELCRSGEADPAWWFPTQHRPRPEKDLAKAICFRCPVREECLDWAVKLPELHGIWGGISVRQRRTISDVRVSQCPVCGVEFTYEVSEAARSPRLYCSPACKRSSRTIVVERSQRKNG